MTPAEREAIAPILERIAVEGLEGPRDLDVALDAIEATIDVTADEARLRLMARAALGVLEEGRASLGVLASDEVRASVEYRLEIAGRVKAWRIEAATGGEPDSLPPGEPG